MESVRFTLSLLTAIAAAYAAFAWFKVATQTVSSRMAERRNEEETAGDGWKPAQITIDGLGPAPADLARTLGLQATWNRRGAIGASIAAAFQAMLVFAPLI